jgi:hypothetical protein
MNNQYECNLCGRPFYWFPFRCRRCSAEHCMSECAVEHEVGCEV